MKNKECNVVLLATNKESRLFIDERDNSLEYTLGRNVVICADTPNSSLKPQHLYILSDEEIKEGDWIIYDNKIVQYKYQIHRHLWTEDDKKILATTDTSLHYNKVPSDEFKNVVNVECNIPQIPESFIKQFVEEYNKGNVIDKVLVEYDMIGTGKVKFPSLLGEMADYIGVDKYKLKLNPDNTINISIPEESKPIELEIVLANPIDYNEGDMLIIDNTIYKLKDGEWNIVEGKIYSRGEVENLCKKAWNDGMEVGTDAASGGSNDLPYNADEWIKNNLK